MQIPWRQIIGLRNRLIHGYDSINFDILWQMLTVDLPSLIIMLEKIVPQENIKQTFAFLRGIRKV